MNELLYQYTSIQSLACILKYKAIRFTRLDCLNDPDEGATVNYGNAAKQVYCSSWTKLSDDTIPMWRMYSGFDGVRLGLPRRMFKVRGDAYRVSGDDQYPVKYSYLEQPAVVTARDEETGQSATKQLGQLLGPDDVIYKFGGSRALGVFQLRQDGFAEDHHNFKKIGLFKADHWAFEDEVRFRLVQNMQVATPAEYGEQFRNSLYYEEQYVDIPLIEGALSKAQITLGPHCKEGPNAIIVEALINKFAPQAQIAKSEIKIAAK